MFFEREGTQKRPRSAGWYSSASFEKFAADEGLYAKSFNGGAFSSEMKQQVIEAIKTDLG